LIRCSSINVPSLVRQAGNYFNPGRDTQFVRRNWDLRTIPFPHVAAQSRAVLASAARVTAVPAFDIFPGHDRIELVAPAPRLDYEIIAGTHCHLTVQVRRIELDDMMVIVEEVERVIRSGKKNCMFIRFNFSAVSKSIDFETEKAL
jgi:hypothetical protein